MSEEAAAGARIGRRRPGYSIQKFEVFDVTPSTSA